MKKELNNSEGIDLKQCVGCIPLLLRTINLVYEMPWFCDFWLSMFHSKLRGAGVKISRTALFLFFFSYVGYV